MAFSEKNKLYLKKLCLSALFLALSLLLPFLTGQIPSFGQALCPMHIPVLLCGFVCGAPWGACVGLAAPLVRSLLFGMPPLFPTALTMALELCVYGLSAGLLYRLLPRKTVFVYPALIGAMAAGRLAWGAANFAIFGLGYTKFSLAAFWAGAVTGSIPGIIIQIILIPLIVIALTKAHLLTD